MESQFNGEARNVSDPTLNEEQCEFSPLVLENIKKEPADVDEFQFSPLILSSMKKGTDKDELIPLQSRCSPSVRNSNVCIKSESQESSHLLNLQCKETTNNETPRSDCSTMMRTSGIRLKNEDSQGRPRSKRICVVKPENWPRKVTANQWNSFPFGEHSLEVSEAKWFKASSEKVISSASSTSDLPDHDCKINNSNVNSSERQSQVEAFAKSPIMKYFNICSTITKNDLEQSLEYKFPRNSGFELFYERKEKFGEKQEPKVSEDSLRPTTDKSKTFGFSAPAVKKPIAKPIRDAELEVSGESSIASSCDSQPDIVCDVQPERYRNAPANISSDVIPSASVTAQTPEILNGHRGSFDSPAQPPTKPSGEGQRIPVINRFLAMKKVD